jgi:hypothetical protein
LQIDSGGKPADDNVTATRRQSGEEADMDLTLVAKDPNSVPDGSPALYRTDRQSWIVQGWAVTDPAALAVLNLPEGETCVEIPDRLTPFFTGP